MSENGSFESDKISEVKNNANCYQYYYISDNSFIYQTLKNDGFFAYLYEHFYIFFYCKINKRILDVTTVLLILMDTFLQSQYGPFAMSPRANSACPEAGNWYFSIICGKMGEISLQGDFTPVAMLQITL